MSGGRKILSCKTLKHVLSAALLLFSVVLVMAHVFNENTKLSADVHPAFAFILLWMVLLWLIIVEGAQASIVGLPPVQRDLFQESHPIAFRICTLTHDAGNLDRYLIGRQFLVVLIIFVTNLCGAPLEDSKQVLGLPATVNDIFLLSCVALTLITTMVGQLNSMVNASHCMLDFINNWFAWFTVHVALLLESCGVLHSVYLVQFLFSYLSGKPINSSGESMMTRTRLQKIWFWGRVVMSVGALGIAFAVTFSALLNDQTSLWSDVPGVLSVALFFALLSLVGILEGMQIAFFAAAKLMQEEEEQEHLPTLAVRTCDLLFQNEGRNLPGFMVGRQISVTFCFLVLARLTTIDVHTDYYGGDDNVFGVSDGLQKLFNTGLLGAIIVATIGSISWQLMASAFPVAFLSNPLVYLLLRWCLLLESTGVCSLAWFLAWIHKRLGGFQPDEVYVGTPEDRAAKQKEDLFEELDRMMHFGVVTTAPPTHDVGAHNNNFGQHASRNSSPVQAGAEADVQISDEQKLDGNADIADENDTDGPPTSLVDTFNADPEGGQSLDLNNTPSSIHSSVTDGDMTIESRPFTVGIVPPPPPPSENAGAAAPHPYLKTIASPASYEDDRIIHNLVGADGASPSSIIRQESNIIQPDSETDSAISIGNHSTPTSTMVTTTTTQADEMSSKAPSMQ